MTKLKLNYILAADGPIPCTWLNNATYFKLRCPKTKWWFRVKHVLEHDKQSPHRIISKPNCLNLFHVNGKRAISFREKKLFWDRFPHSFNTLCPTSQLHSLPEVASQNCLSISCCDKFSSKYYTAHSYQCGDTRQRWWGKALSASWGHSSSGWLESAESSPGCCKQAEAYGCVCDHCHQSRRLSENVTHATMPRSSTTLNTTWTT